MPNLREQIRQFLQGRVCLMGLGNVDYGDDGFGVRLAEKLEAAGLNDVIIAATMPDRFIGGVIDSGYDTLLFIDAVEFGGEPGAVIFLNTEEMAARFPQVSTHKISLGLMAEWVEDGGKTKARLLGVQPESLSSTGELTPTVQATLEALSNLLCDLWNDSNGSYDKLLPDKERLACRPKAEAPITEVSV